MDYQFGIGPDIWIGVFLLWLRRYEDEEVVDPRHDQFAYNISPIEINQ